jgi:hypothetical protein
MCCSPVLVSLSCGIALHFCEPVCKSGGFFTPTPLETFIPYHGRVIADCVTNFLNLMEKFVHLYMCFGCPLDFADAMNVE